MRISTAADLVGVPAHVLRHWEDEGVLTPSRSGANQRDFTDQHVNEARIVHRLRQAGLGLPAIRELRGADRAGRAALLSATADRLSAEAERAAAAAEFLRHVTSCRHPVVDDCAGCRQYAKPADSAPTGMSTGRA